METTKLVNVRVKCIRPKYDNLKEWMADPNNVYIGRKGVVLIDGKRFPPQDSIFANPFKVGRDGTREEVIDKYKQELIAKVVSGEITEEDVLNLKGKTLGCWCSPEPCHGDILLKLLDVWDEYQEIINEMK
jgi:hypothetical protein